MRIKPIFEEIPLTWEQLYECFEERVDKNYKYVPDDLKVNGWIWSSLTNNDRGNTRGAMYRHKDGYTHFKIVTCGFHIYYDVFEDTERWVILCDGEKAAKTHEYDARELSSALNRITMRGWYDVKVLYRKKSVTSYTMILTRKVSKAYSKKCAVGAKNYYKHLKVKGVI